MNVKVVKDKQMPKEILITKCYSYLRPYEKYSPDELIKIATRMKEDGVSSCKVSDNYGNIEFEYFRMETEQEESDRLKREVMESEQRLANMKNRLMREAEAFGFELRPKV